MRILGYRIFLETFGTSLDKFEGRMVKYIGNVEYNKSIYKPIADYLKKRRFA